MSLSKTQSGSANVTNVGVNDQAQTPVQRNDNREGLLIFNDADTALLVSFGENVSTSEFSLKIPAGGYYESGATVYMGPIHIVWTSAGAGQALITELEV